MGKQLSRRDFLALSGVSAAGMLAGCAGGGGSGATLIPEDVEVVVIGAGVAGMAAGRALRAAGRSFVILEARDRPGGRVYSNNAFPKPFDYGAQLFQQCVPVGSNPQVTVNPLFNIAVRQNAPIQSLVDQIAIDNGQPLTQEQILEQLGGFLLLDDQIKTVGQQAAMSEGLDVSAVQASAVLAGTPFYDANLLLYVGDRGMPSDQVSAEELYYYSRWTSKPFGMPSTDNWFIASGMGNFVAQFAAGLPIRYSTEVTNVDRSGSGVKVSTAAGTISAKAVIVTASTGVLASGRPNFSPALPAEYTEAINNLPMGSVGKVGFEFDQDVFGGLTGTTSIVSIQPPAPDLLAAMFAKFFGSNECYIVLGGGAFREIEQAGEGAMTELATQVVGGMLGSDAVSHIVRTDTHSWLNDPWAMGAYSSAKIGHFSARKQLQEPIDGKVFFAGEAVALEAAGSMHGAWLTAEAAVGAYLQETARR